MKKILPFSIFTCCLTVSVVASASDSRPPEKIVNGLWTQAEPTTAALVEGIFSDTFCSGTLIGCQTVLTAAHCVCKDPRAACEGDNVRSPDDFSVYLQHFGHVAVESVTPSPDFVLLQTSDLAVLRLAEPVTGITPAPINDIESLNPGTPVTMVGFGFDSSTGGGAANLYGINGIKRTVATETQSCYDPSDEQHLCYTYEPPYGAPGQDGTACFTDSGGPMFTTVGDRRVLVGVAEAVSSVCRPPHVSASHTSVYANLDWIVEALGDDEPSAASCGSLAAAGDPDTTVMPFRGYLYPADDVRNYTFDIQPGAQALRVTLNSGGLANARLYPGDAAAGNPFCTFGEAEGCEVNFPEADTWTLRVSGTSGDYQATATVFYPPGSGDGQGGLPVASNPSEFCVPSQSTLCLDAESNDRRFQVEVTYDTQVGSGARGKAFSLPVATFLRGGLLWFFSPDNPEMLVKVLNGCEINDHFWVFAAATTNVGYELTVTDQVTGAVYRSVNPDGQVAQPVADVTAFPCRDGST